MPEQVPDSPQILTSLRRSASRSATAAEELEPVRVNLRDPLAVGRRHLWLGLGMTAVAGGIVGRRAYAAVPAYRAIAVIRRSDPQRALTGGVADATTGALSPSS